MLLKRFIIWKNEVVIILWRKKSLHSVAAPHWPYLTIKKTVVGQQFNVIYCSLNTVSQWMYLHDIDIQNTNKHLYTDTFLFVHITIEFKKDEKKNQIKVWSDWYGLSCVVSFFSFLIEKHFTKNSYRIPRHNSFDIIMFFSFVWFDVQIFSKRHLPDMCDGFLNLQQNRGTYSVKSFVLLRCHPIVDLIGSFTSSFTVLRFLRVCMLLVSSSNRKW